MRFLILILIFINIGVWTYLNQNYFFQLEKASPNEELAADKLTLLSPHQLEALTSSLPSEEGNDTDKETQVDDQAKADKPAPEPQEQKKKETDNAQKQASLQCYRWGALSESELNKAQALSKKLGLKTSVKTTTQGKAQRYWVYLPPASSAEAAQSTAAALKAQGISDLYVLTGPKWKNAISFGVFSDSKYADNMLKSLKAKGVQNVVKAPRGQATKSQFHLSINAVSKTNYQKIKKQQKAISSAKLQSTPCK